MGFEPALLLAGLLFVTLIVGAYTDVARGKIYDWCTYPAIALGLVVHVVIGEQTGHWLHLVHSALGLAVGICIFLLPYYLGLVGGGDVKLMGAVGALQGANFALTSAFLAAVVGAIFGISVLIWKGRLGPAAKNLRRAAFTPWKLKDGEQADDTHLPYGLAVALGTFWAWFVAVGILG